MNETFKRRKKSNFRTCSTQYFSTCFLTLYLLTTYFVCFKKLINFTVFENFVAERTDLSYPPVIETINVLEPNADLLQPGDKIHQIDGISTIGITNQQVLNVLLCHRDENAIIEIEYSLPEYRKIFANFLIKGKSKKKFLKFQYHKTVYALPPRYQILQLKGKTGAWD